MSLFYKPSAGGGDTVTVVDDFEDGDIAEYSGATGSYTANTNAPVYNGSYSLKASASTAAELISTSGLNEYPAQGDTYVVQVRFSSDANVAGVLFGVQDTNNLYLVQIHAGSDNFQLFVESGGGFTKLAEDTAATIGASEWYECRIDWATDGTITPMLLDSADSQVSQISATDTSYSSGGIGFRSNASNSIYDYARVV